MQSVIYQLSAMKVTIYQFKHLIAVVGNFAAQRSVAIRAQFLNYAIDHRRAEHVIFLERNTLALEAVGRGLTAVGEASE